MEAICVKLFSKSNGTGLIRPIWIVDNKADTWNPVTVENFDCSTGKIFVGGGYDEIDRSRPTDLWKVYFDINQRQAGDCKYISDKESGRHPRQVKPKDLLEVLASELPNPECGILDVQHCAPMTSYIAVQNSEKMVYGVFEQNSDVGDDGIIVKVALLNSPVLPISATDIKTLRKLSISSIPGKHVIEIEIDGHHRTFLRDPFEIFRDPNIEQVEYMSNEDVLALGWKALELTSPTMIKKTAFPVLKKNYLSNKISEKIGKSFIDRFFDIVGSIENQQDLNFEWTKKFFQSERGKPIISAVLNDAPELLDKLIGKEAGWLSSKAEERIGELRKQEREFESRAKEEESKLADLRRQIRDAEDRLKDESKDKQAKIEDYKGLLNKEAEELQERLVQLGTECAAVEGRLAKLIDVETLDGKKKQLESDSGYLERRKNALEQDLDDVKKQLGSEQAKLTKELLRLKPYVEALTGFGDVDESRDGFNVPTVPVAKIGGAIESASIDLLEKVEKRMIAANRQYSRPELVNFLVSIQQSFMTVFAGLPGVGKTSLVRLLSEALGIQERLLEVAVGRGWTSNRDLVGYYNPLSMKFQSSATNVWEMLSQTQGDQLKNQPNSIILLDEANLSPIEHYWSDFMLLTDRPNEKRIKFGTQSLAIPQNLRFVSTINYDATTEPLSPRMLDRTPIIVLQPPEDCRLDFDDPASQVDVEMTNDAWSAQDMASAFGVPSFSQQMSHRTIFQEIWLAATASDPAKGRPIALSPRKLELIVNYCKMANPFMRDYGDMLALDYAVAQHVLPLVSGNGDGYRKRLEDLKALFEKYEMEMSLVHIERVLEIGRQDLDSYNFFSW